MLPWTVLKQYHSLKDWVAVIVHVHWIITTEELVAFQVIDDKLLNFWNDGLECLDLGLILESGEECAPEISVDKLVELQHLEFHLTCLHSGGEITWLGLMWPDREALGSTLVVGSELGNYSRLEDDGAIGSLQERNKTTVDFLVPLSLDSEIDLNLLELNFFGL